MLRTSILGLLLSIVACHAAGQTETAAPKSFGTDDGAFTVIGFDDFFPADSSDGWEGPGGNARSSSGTLLAGLNMIPNGAFVTGVAVYARDVDPAEDVQAELCSSSWEIVSGESGVLNCDLGGAGGVSTSGTPVNAVLFMSVDRRILFQENVPGIDETVVNHFFLRVHAPGPLTSVRMARVHWRRQVRPAPNFATFGDVPTDHPFFQFVEALALSGITAGCGSDNYCPDAALTRGQMAVFLSKALGLHFPWEAVVAARSAPMP